MQPHTSRKFAPRPARSRALCLLSAVSPKPPERSAFFNLFSLFGQLYTPILEAHTECIMKNTPYKLSFFFAMIALVASAVVPSFTYAGKSPAPKAPAMQTKCATYVAPTLVSVSAPGTVTWINNAAPKAKDGAYILVQRSVFINGTDWYWGPLYSWWTSYESLYPKLDASATSFVDPSPVVGAAAVKYRVVLFNSCGVGAASAEQVI